MPLYNPVTESISQEEIETIVDTKIAEIPTPTPGGADGYTLVETFEPSDSLSFDYTFMLPETANNLKIVIETPDKGTSCNPVLVLGSASGGGANLGSTKRMVDNGTPSNFSGERQLRLNSSNNGNSIIAYVTNREGENKNLDASGTAFTGTTVSSVKFVGSYAQTARVDRVTVHSDFAMTSNGAKFPLGTSIKLYAKS